jgi:hypothetical protein
VPVACSVFGLGLFVFVAYYRKSIAASLVGVKKGTNKVSATSTATRILSGAPSAFNDLPIVEHETSPNTENRNSGAYAAAVESSSLSYSEAQLSLEGEISDDTPSVDIFPSGGSSFLSESFDFSLPSIGSSVLDEADTIIRKKSQGDYGSFSSNDSHNSSDASISFSEDSIFT